MNLCELEDKIKKMRTPDSYYTINGSPLPNRYVLNHVFNYWECYYMDERGEKNKYKKYYQDEDAFEYFFNLLKFEMEN